MFRGDNSYKLILLSSRDTQISVGFLNISDSLAIVSSIPGFGSAEKAHALKKQTSCTYVNLF